jgi:hypothetical protein
MDMWILMPYCLLAQLEITPLHVYNLIDTVSRNCKFIKEPDDQGDFCAFCLTELHANYENETFDVDECQETPIALAEVE